MKLESLKRLATSAVVTAALGGAMLANAPRLYADDDHGDCQRKVERAEGKVDQAVRKHGEGSHEAEERRRDLNAERERCWERYHGWWDARERRWHSDRDWDYDRDHRDDHHDDQH